MAIKKYNHNNPDNWVNQATSGASESEKKPSVGRKKAEKKIPFAARIPENLYSELKEYVETYADEKESINDIIVSGARAELETRLKKHNAIIAAETRREELIETIEKSVKELKILY
jgi:hypothetical protein